MEYAANSSRFGHGCGGLHAIMGASMDSLVVNAGGGPPCGSRHALAGALYALSSNVLGIIVIFYGRG